MAKRSNNDEGGKIEFVFVKLEGSNETIRQTVKTIADAIKPNAIVMRPPLPPAEERRGLEAWENDDIQEITVEQVEKPAPRKRSDSKAKAPPRPPEPLDLDLTSGEMPFKKYVEAKQPKADSEKYVLIADWLKKYRGTNPINKAHIYTCYKVMGWSAPEDLNQVFRSLKNKDFRQEGAGQYAITIVGENRIGDLGASEG